MAGKKSERRSCNYNRSIPGSGRTRSMVADYEQACLAAGLILAASFGLMFMWAAVML